MNTFYILLTISSIILMSLFLLILIPYLLAIFILRNDFSYISNYSKNKIINLIDIDKSYNYCFINMVNGIAKIKKLKPLYEIKFIIDKKYIDKNNYIINYKIKWIKDLTSNKYCTCTYEK